MNSFFYPKLAVTNLRKNGKIYRPYLLTCIITVLMFYTINAISRNAGIQEMPGAYSLKLMLTWTSAVTDIFSVVFLFYTNSFLVKRRKKEFGLYQVLGMDKKNIAKMMAWETLQTACVSLFVGLLSGILLSKLVFLILLKILHFEVPLKFAIEGGSIVRTLILFLGIFAATLIYNLFQVQAVNPVELLHGGNQGEKEPKTKFLLTIFGVVTLGIGYYIAQTTESPLIAIPNFFIAVILVIAGTYALFTAGSIAGLKMLRRNKNYYYNKKHFTPVSGMIYRMKQNAVGLANICIFSTIVLVLVSTSISVYAGMEDIIKTRFPAEFKLSIRGGDPNSIASANQIIEEELAKANITSENREQMRYGSMAGLLKDNKISLTERDTDLSYIEDSYVGLVLVSLSDYNQMEGTNVSLAEGEVLVSNSKGGFSFPTLELEGKSYDVKQVLRETSMGKYDDSYALRTFYIVMRDETQVQELLLKNPMPENQQMRYMNSFDLKGEEERADTMAALSSRLQSEVPEAAVEYRSAFKQSGYALYGGFLFLGIFIGGLFLMATVLIIYYKQISEGYDDKERYQILQKVGMSQMEVKRSIKSQVLLVFFLPLAVAVLHIAMAFKVITKLLEALNLINVKLFFGCTAGTVLVFAILYGVVFFITSREYYKIVR